MANERVTIVFGAEYAELVRAAQQVKGELDGIGAAAERAGGEIDAAGNDALRDGTAGFNAFSDAVSFVGSSIDTVLKGVLLGTQSWQESMRRIFADLALSFAENVTDMMLSWLTFEALGIGTGAAGGGLLSGLLGGGGSAVSAAALGTLAMFEDGAWSVPRDMVAMVHQGEMILPAQVAELARSGAPAAPFPSGAPLAPQSGGSVTLNVKVEALDAGSVANWANANARTLAGAVARYMGMNPSAARD